MIPTSSSDSPGSAGASSHGWSAGPPAAPGDHVGGHPLHQAGADDVPDLLQIVLVRVLGRERQRMVRAQILGVRIRGTGQCVQQLRDVVRERSSFFIALAITLSSGRYRALNRWVCRSTTRAGRFMRVLLGMGNGSLARAWRPACGRTLGAGKIPMVDVLSTFPQGMTPSAREWPAPACARSCGRVRRALPDRPTGGVR